MILLTGASGFLGQTIKNVLNDHEIISIGRNQADIVVDLGKKVPVLPPLDIIIHAAGKAHSIPKTEQQKHEFYNVNVAGTENLLTALDAALTIPKAFVFISSVAVYGRETGININENFPLNATDPYGRSKIEAEQLISHWCIKNNVKCTILRLPLVVGSNPPGNLKAMVDSIKKGYYFNIAGGRARKSMVLAEDVAEIILTAAEIGGIYNLADGYHPSFTELSFVIAKQLKKRPPLNLPKFLGKVMALAGDILGSKAPLNSNKLNKITSDLTFDDSKARNLLGWKPRMVLEWIRTYNLNA